MSTTWTSTVDVFAAQIRPGDVILESFPPDRQTVWMTSTGSTCTIHYTDSDGADGVRECADWWAFTVASPRNVMPSDRGE